MLSSQEKNFLKKLEDNMDFVFLGWKIRLDIPCLFLHKYFDGLASCRTLPMKLLTFSSHFPTYFLFHVEFLFIFCFPEKWKAFFLVVCVLLSYCSLFCSELEQLYLLCCSDIYPFLEKVCLDGSRAQAKLAVSAIAALMAPSEQSIFLDLCKVANCHFLGIVV